MWCGASEAAACGVLPDAAAFDDIVGGASGARVCASFLVPRLGKNAPHSN